MGIVIGLLASIVAILGVLAAVGYGGYLFMLQSVAAKRPGATHLASDARGKLPVAGGLTLVTLVGLLITSGDSVAADVVGLLLAGGAGFAATSRWQEARRRLASPPR